MAQNSNSLFADMLYLNICFGFTVNLWEEKMIYSTVQNNMQGPMLFLLLHCGPLMYASTSKHIVTDFFHWIMKSFYIV